jgi:hypothetical protein
MQPAGWKRYALSRLMAGECRRDHYMLLSLIDDKTEGIK